MNTQGAGFAFDATMDFSAFTMPQQQQSFLKPSEDNTSSFFGDEGIDTSASFIDPAMFSTPQTSFDMQQSFALDNTSGSTTAWDSLTPDLTTLNTFPPTPVQSFDGLYQQPTSLGKRALPLDVQDFPQSKRHEPMTDFTLFSPYASTATSSSWPVEAQSTPASTAEVGLSDEAADMCAMWFHKYSVLPSDRHIDSLSQLTGEPADAIRSWFGRLLKQGMGNSQSDSAYKSQTGQVSQQQEQFWKDQFSTDLAQTSPTQLMLEDNTSPEAPCNHDTTTLQPATTLRGSKKRCTPTDDQQLLTRDPNKIYQCTRKCGKRYGRKCDWKRNEEEGYPCKSWVCSLCVSEGMDNVKPCFRKYHFVQHFRNIHPEINADDYEESSVVSSETEFPRNCGFCRHRFESRQERIDHIAEHFKQGKCMLDWNDDGPDHGSGSDNSDDDDDNQPSSDGFGGGKPSYQPPSSGPSSGSSKYYGGGSGGSSTGQQPSGGFFQFQLSQLGEGDHSGEICANQHIKPMDALHSRRSSQSEPEPEDEDITHGFSSIQPPTQPRQYVPTTGDDKTPLARNALPRPIMSGIEDISLLQHVETTSATNAINLKHANNAAGESVADRTVFSPRALDENINSEETSLAMTTALVVQPALSRGVLSEGVRDINSPSPSPESKVTSFPKTKALNQMLIAKQAPQNLTAPSRFLSTKFLGAGGFSTVDEVVDRITSLRVVRKTLKNRDRTAIREILQETGVLQKIRHPHIIRFLEAYAKDNKVSMIVSPVADTTLALWLDQSMLKKPAGLGETIVRMFGCLASSVRYLHEQRPVVKHKDIKPQNILIVGGDEDFPHVVLCDFGISTSEEMPDEQLKPLTRKYVAPEVLRGFSREQAADIWSLGCVFAEMATIPFSEENAAWLSIRNAFSGRSSKPYCEDVPDLQAKLSKSLEHATSPREETVAKTLKSMLSSEPAERPIAASLTMIFTPAPCCLNWANDKAIFPGPHAELGGVEMLVHQDGVDCSTQQCQHGNAPEANESPLARAKCWLDDCSDSHEACRQSTATGTKALPTRLVDVLPDGQATSFVRVVNSASISLPDEETDYIALGHVWNETQITLSSEWLQDKLTELPLQTLPAEINIAISSAQRLGYRYIWVDSLCVIQDSEQDKQQECTTMASIFRNAALTMVLDQLTTENVKSKIHATSIAENDDQPYAPGRMQRSGSPKSRLPASAALPAIDFTTPGFAWDTRAWALQERLLSRRFLHLGEQMYWECNALKASETFPRGLSPLVWEKVHSVSPERVSVLSNHSRVRNGGSAMIVSGFGLLDKQHHLSTISRGRDSQLVRTQGDNTSVSTPTTLTANIAEVNAPPVCGCDAEHTRPNAPTTDSHDNPLTTCDITLSDAHAQGNFTCHTNHMSLGSTEPSKSSEPLITDSRNSRNRRNGKSEEKFGSNKSALDDDVMKFRKDGNVQEEFEDGKI